MFTTPAPVHVLFGHFTATPIVQSFTTNLMSLAGGENASLLCLATGSPHPRVRIFADGRPMVIDVRLLSNNTVEATVTVFKQAVYTCTSENRAGSDMTKLTICKTDNIMF